MANLNLLDVAKLNGSDAVVGLIEEIVTVVPELDVFPARTIRGTSYKTVTRTGLPTVGFRSANEGVTPSKSTFTDETIQMYILDAQIEIDSKVADADERGRAHLQALESVGTAKAAAIELAGQIWYGVTNDAKGFPGVKAFTPFGGTYTSNAAGTSAGTASSAYFLKFGEQDVTMLWGNGMTLTLGNWREQQLTDSNGKKYTGLVNDLGGWTGLQLGNQYCASRICNITADSTKTLTEEKIFAHLDLLPAAYKPDAMFLSRRSMGQLRVSMAPSITIKSMTAATVQQSSMQAKRQIEESTGMQVIITDAILDTDAIES
jgi:hypothetical protein